MWSSDRLITDVGQPRPPSPGRGAQLGPGVSPGGGGRPGRQYAQGSGASEAEGPRPGSSTPGSLALKVPSTLPPGRGKAHGRALPPDQTYPLAAWCPKSRPRRRQPWGPGGSTGSWDHCWVSARHLGRQRYQGPTGPRAEVALGWAAGGLATLDGWLSEVSGLHVL